jgi:RHS repeat-associated protein
VFEEYRYDALGRRIMVRGRPDPRCTLAGCEAYLDSYVWDGAQILSEWRQGSAGGRVTYTHGPGIDAPVSLWHGGTTMVLHANRGGLIDMATDINGTRVDPDPYTWAGLQTPLYPRYASRAMGTSWLGSLVANKHDGSGLVYMRNRYLNPQTGQFTQTDPIGLAGGLNLYGYAGGDPVNFHDPFGLRAQGCCTREDAADIGVGLIPVVGNLHDAHTAIRGKNIVTGDDASTGDRLFAAAGIVLPVSGGALKGGKVVIGETMKRVRNYASRVRAETFETTATTARQMFRENMSWLRGKMRQGSEVVGIGTDPQRAVRSPYYRAEQELIERRNYPVTRDPQP